jgi:hypothetical protein
MREGRLNLESRRAGKESAFSLRAFLRSCFFRSSDAAPSAGIRIPEDVGHFARPFGQGGYIRRSTMVSIAGLGIALLTGILWQFDRPPFDLAKLQSLETGMSQAQVVEILGPPRKIYGERWSYARSLSWPVVQIHFDGAGKLIRYEYDP